MARGLQLVVPPSGDPVSLAEAKAWLRVSIPDDDGLIAGLITGATRYVEDTINRSFVSRQYLSTIDRFPRYSSSAVWQYNSDAIWQQRLPMTQLSGQWYPDRASIRVTRPPLQAVLGITYVDTVLGTQTVNPSVYSVDTTTEPGRIAPAYGQIWPIVQMQLASVQVSFVAGSGPVTSIVSPFATGTQTVTPASMFGIYVGTLLAIDDGTGREVVSVTAVTSTTFTATFGKAHGPACSVGPGMPEDLRTAIKMLAGHWYENREAMAEKSVTKVGLAFESILMAHDPMEYE